MNETETETQAAAKPQTFQGHLPAAELARVMDVKVEVTVELGRRRMSIAEVLQMAPHSVLEFYKKADEPLDVYVNGRLVARGEAVIMGDRYGVRLTELIGPERQQGQIDPAVTP